MSDRPLWYEIAEKEIGVTEIPGPANNPRVVEYHSATSYGAKDDEVPWCSSFLNWVMKKAGLPGTNNAAARSWMSWGVPIETPVLGCVVVYWRDKPDGWTGHVHLYRGEDDTHIVGLGGNQGNSVNLSRYPKNRVLGFRWPKDVPLPAPAPAAPTPPPPISSWPLENLMTALSSHENDLIGINDRLVKCIALVRQIRDAMKQ